MVDHPLSEGLGEDDDTAVYKPNPWSIARINAASRSAQKYALRSRVVSRLRSQFCAIWTRIYKPCVELMVFRFRFLNFDPQISARE